MTHIGEGDINSNCEEGGCPNELLLSSWQVCWLPMAFQLLNRWHCLFLFVSLDNNLCHHKKYISLMSQRDLPPSIRLTIDRLNHWQPRLFTHLKKYSSWSSLVKYILTLVPRFWVMKAFWLKKACMENRYIDHFHSCKSFKPIVSTHDFPIVKIFKILLKH